LPISRTVAILGKLNLEELAFLFEPYSHCTRYVSTQFWSNEMDAMGYHGLTLVAQSWRSKAFMAQTLSWNITEPSNFSWGGKEKAL